MTTFIANGAIYDNFADLAVGTALAGRVSVSGHLWVEYNETWQVQDAPGVNDNALGTIDIGEFCRAGIDFGSADVDVEACMEFYDLGNALPAGIMFRRTATGYYVFETAGGGTWQLVKVTDAGVGTVLATYAVGVTYADYQAPRVVCVGSAITAYVDGVELGSVTDSTYGGTVHGVFQRFAGEGNAARFFAFNMHAVPVTGWVVGVEF